MVDEIALEAIDQGNQRIEDVGIGGALHQQPFGAEYFRDFGEYRLPACAGHDIGVHLTRAPDTFKSSISFAADDEAGGGGAASAQHARKARGAGAQDHFASHLGAGTFMEDVISQAPVVGGAARRAQDGAGGARSLAVASAKGSVTALVERLRAELATRGARGIVGLGRKFRIIDDDGRCVRAARRVGGNGASG